MNKHYLLYGSERYALGILRPLQAAIRRRGDRAAWFFDGPGGEDLGADEELLGSVAEARKFAPVAVFAPGNHIPHLIPGVKVGVFHGFDAGKPRHIYIRGYFDLYCTTGPSDTAAFKRLAEQYGHFAVVETGWPKLDPYGDFKSVANDAKPVILYHSTFSPSWSAADILYAEIKRLVATDRWHWIVSLHPKMNAATVERYRALQGDNLEYPEVDNILDLFPRADLMISDTSSALNEYLLWRKPVITFKNRRPGPQLIDIDDPALLQGAIETALRRPPELMQAITDYAHSLYPYRDSASSERVLAAVDQFIAAGARNPRRKPFNFWRRLKMRRRLGFWRP